jgi:hypothetical protein
MYNKLPIETQNKPIEYINEIQYTRSLDLSDALNKWYDDFLKSSAYSQYLKEYNIINYSEFFILNPDFKLIDLVLIYATLPSANNQIKLLEFLFGTGNEIKIVRKRHKYLEITLTKTIESLNVKKNIITTDSKNLVTSPNSKNIIASLQKFNLTDPNLVNLFFLITNFNTKYDFTIINNEDRKTYYNYDFNHNPTLT